MYPADILKVLTPAHSLKAVIFHTDLRIFVIYWFVTTKKKPIKLTKTTQHFEVNEAIHIFLKDG